VYQIATGTSARASVGTAFRNPTIYNLYRTWQSSSGTIYRSNPDLEPEKLTSWEAGLVQRFGRRFQLEGSYYDNSVRNLIYLQVDLVSDPTGKTQIYRNAGKARMRGTEISAKQKILSWLQLQEAYSYTHALITENTAVPASVGKRVTNVPWHQASGMLLVSRGRFSGTFSGRYVARAYGTDTNTDVTTGVPSSFDPFFEATVSVAVQVTKRFAIQGGGENLLDRRYYESYIVPGRTVYVGLRIGL
jgi:iron complex outermembrane receptor protein